MTMKALTGLITIGSVLIGAGIYLGLLDSRVSAIEEEISRVAEKAETKVDKPIPEIACESYNLSAVSMLGRNNICPTGYFRFADWFYGTIEKEHERWTLCCRYITQISHTPKQH